MQSGASSAEGMAWPFRLGKNAATDSPHSASEYPKTNTSRMEVCVNSTSSTAGGERVVPPVRFRAYVRSLRVNRPSASNAPTSPVYSHPSCKDLLVASGRFQ